MKLTKKGHEVLDKAIPLWHEAEHQILDESEIWFFDILSSTKSI